MSHLTCDKCGVTHKWTENCRCPKPEGSLAPATGSVELALIEALRDQALRDAESAARGKGYSAAANWQAWAMAYDHLLVTVRSQTASQNTELTRAPRRVE